MHSSHAARRQKILRLLQNAWVTRNIAVTQSVFRESYSQERVHAVTRTVTVIKTKWLRVVGRWNSLLGRVPSPSCFLICPEPGSTPRA
jgi:hypothetical protein